ncbi:MAG: TetR/AcrR family transcriptional regulator [Anaerolineales bacterium]|nr:MAG: TetR/AcrR family transcriptional regulator [Anaerolineales bacterium]
MSTAQDPIREQLIGARRVQILDAATSVFAEKGFHRATTKEIANAAGVSEGTIYNYFANKADLLIGIMVRLADLQQLGPELTDGLHTDVRDFFAAIFRHRMSRVEASREMIQAILPEVLVNTELRQRFYQQFVLQIVTLLEQYLEAEIELGHIRPVNVPLTVRAVQSLFVGLLILQILGDEPLRSGWDDMPETLSTLLFDGLKPEQGA